MCYCTDRSQIFVWTNATNRPNFNLIGGQISDLLWFQFLLFPYKSLEEIQARIASGVLYAVDCML